MKRLEDALLGVVEGNLDNLTIVLDTPHADLLRAAENLPPISMSRSALIRVLNEWRMDRYGAFEVQQWASFVRHGFVVGGRDGPIQPIDIAYDPVAEEVIVEVVGRLTEIGDVIDGTVDDIERQKMLKDLEDCRE